MQETDLLTTDAAGLEAALRAGAQLVDVEGGTQGWISSGRAVERGL